MISRDTGPLRIVQNGRRARFVNDIIFRVLEIHAFLFPEEVDVEACHQRSELVGDVLEGFGIGFERADEVGIGGKQFWGHGEGGEFLEAGEKVGFGGASVWGAEEEDAVGAGVDGVEVGDLGGCSTRRIG